jgi:hypothetical protein
MVKGIGRVRGGRGSSLGLAEAKNDLPPSSPFAAA